MEVKFIQQLYVYSCIILLLLFGCSTKNTQPNPTVGGDVQAILKPSSDLLKLKIDKRTSNLSNYVFPYFHPDGRQYLCYLNPSNLELHQFDIDEQVLIKTIKLDAEGPYGVAPVSGFYVHALDSIYVGSMRKAIHLVDGEGKVKQTIRYKNTLWNDYSFVEPFPLMASHVFTPLVLVKNKMYLFSMAQGSFTDLKAGNKLAKQRVCFEIDTLKNTGKFLPFTYPQDYWSKGVIEPSLSRVYAHGKFIYSFFGDHNLYITEDHTVYAKYFAGSNNFSEFKYYPSLEPSTDEYIRFFSETSGYWSIMYDPFREVFYRFVVIGNDPDSGISPQKAVSYSPHFSIILLDKNFNKIGEVAFKNNSKYVFTNSFIGRKGLYISNNHPDNPTNEEDYLSFTLFELIQIK